MSSKAIKDENLDACMGFGLIMLLFGAGFAAGRCNSDLEGGLIGLGVGAGGFLLIALVVGAIKCCQQRAAARENITDSQRLSQQSSTLENTAATPN